MQYVVCIIALSLIVAAAENVVLRLLLEVLGDSLCYVGWVKIVEDVFLCSFFRLRFNNAVECGLNRLIFVAAE